GMPLARESSPRTRACRAGPGYRASEYRATPPSPRAQPGRPRRRHRRSGESDEQKRAGARQAMSRSPEQSRKPCLMNDFEVHRHDMSVLGENDIVGQRFDSPEPEHQLQRTPVLVTPVSGELGLDAVLSVR